MLMQFKLAHSVKIPAAALMVSVFKLALPTHWRPEAKFRRCAFRPRTMAKTLFRIAARRCTLAVMQRAMQTQVFRLL